MSTTSALPSQTVDDEQLLRLAERIAALRLSTDSRSSLRDSTTHSKTLSCFSFLRGIFSNRTHAVTTPFRPIVRPLGTTQSDPGVVERNMQPRGPLQDLPNDDTSSSMGPLQLGSVAGSGLSAVDLERVHDSSFKRAKDTQLPAGGAFMGHADSRSVDMFLQEVKRAPGWSVGVMPQLFQAYYLEFSLDVSVRGVTTGIVDKDLKQRGLEGYDALVARAAAIESALRARFDSINSHRILADRWESIRWNVSDDFEKFFLEFQEIRDSYSRQRGQELRGADVVERLFGALPKELADRLIRQYGGNPSEQQILEFCRRENMILTRNRAMKNGPSRSTTRSNINSVYVEEEDDRLEQRPDGFFVMPVEQTSTSTQTNNRLFVSNLAFSASERDLLGAFRSVLRLSGAVPRGIRLFKDGRNKSRGIGLIEFDTADAATRALGVVDGQQVLGRKVRARRDRGASSSAPSSGSSSETPSGSASGAKRRRTDDGSGAAAAANAPQGATGDTEGSGNSVDVRCVQSEDQSCDTCDADGASKAEDQSPDTTPVAVKDGTLCSVVGTLDFGHVDHQDADIDIELCKLGQGSVAGKPLTTVCSLVSVRAGYDTTNKVDWLLDSGCALHLIDKNTHPWLCNARSVLLPKPVRLIFANGTSQSVDEAKLVAFVYNGHRCYSHVLVVEGLTVSGILSLHQLANDFGTVAWHLNDDTGEVLRLGSHVVLQPRPSGPPQLNSSPTSSPLVEVFSTPAELLSTILKEIDVLNAWRLRRSPSLDGKYSPKFELRRMTKLPDNLRDMAFLYCREICIGSISGAENPADLGTRLGTNDVPAKMMLLSGKAVEVALSKARVISTHSARPPGCPAKYEPFAIASIDRRLPTEDEFLRILSRAVTIVNMTPYVDGSPLCPFLVCRGHSRMIGNVNAKKEADDIRKAIFDGLEPPTWWSEELAQLYRDRLGEGRIVALKELADVWWLRRRDVREKLMSRVKRHASRDLIEGAKVYRWRPMLGKFGKLNTGWSPAVLVKKMSSSVCKVRLPDGKEVTESVLNLRPAGVCR